MNTSKTTNFIGTTAAAIAAALSLLAATPATAQPVPSYATGTSDETVHGTIVAVNGKYNISVRDARGFIDNVNLHQGTIINPTGIPLAPGLSVTILGHNDGSALSANEIDTPYQTLSAYPVYPGYPGYGYYGYPYPYGGYYGYGRYGYGPSFGGAVRFGRGFGFGFRG